MKMVNKYYQKKQKLWKEARERYQNLSGEKKKERWKKIWDRYKNLSEEGKEKKSSVSSWLKLKTFSRRKTKESWGYEKLSLIT